MKPRYTVTFLDSAKKQMKILRDATSMSRLRGFFAEAARLAIQQLETRPHNWGDPLRKTAKPGGRIYRGPSHP